MNHQITPESLNTAYRTALDRLLARMHPDGYWEGRLSSSALSTATAVSALSLASGGAGLHAAMIDGGCEWMCKHQNADGGWGDTIDSPSTLATTMLVIAALHLAGRQEQCARSLAHAGRYVDGCAGRGDLVAAIRAAYGKDRTFAVPILANCALAGLVPWKKVPRLPFVLAALPHGFYKSLRLHMVSYALPALISIGLLLDSRKGSANPARIGVRALTERMILDKLERIQPDSGGYLEAIPLTSFVAMSLIPLYGAGQPVAARCVQFIERSVRPDGSWAIDSNLSVWLTTNAVKGLAGGGLLGEIDGKKTRRWIADRQYRHVHPYTQSEPGAWGWTHLPGGVPDTDDTCSALLALHALGEKDSTQAAADWLLQLQNKDGGWPTFCRGWGRLAFDRSSPDLTAHAIRALGCFAGPNPNGRILPAMKRGLRFLVQSQRPDGSWLPLWFGNQLAPGKHNPVMGAALVLTALCEVDAGDVPAAKGASFIVRAQNSDGGWGGDRAVASSVEETALAVGALARFRHSAEARAAAARGAAYLVRRIDDGTWCHPAPLGLYFAKLWYSEELYPLIWTVDALGQAIGNGIFASEKDNQL